MKEWEISYWENRWQKAIERYFVNVLKKHIKKKKEIIEDELKNYSFNITFTDKKHGKCGSYSRRGKYRDGVYWDTSLGIVLTWGDIPIACIGFEIEGLFFEKIVIKQIQGVSSTNYYKYTQNKTGELIESFSKIKWERFLIQLIIKAGKDIGYNTFAILPAELNYWLPYNRELEKSFKMRYNVTAKRMKFKYSKFYKLFIKKF